jgi:pilus assembly protein CpaB
MKNTRAVAMVVVSVGLAMGAVILASKWVKDQAHVATSKVVVAKGDIQLGSRLSPIMLKIADWPQNSVPEGAVDDPEKLKDRVVRTTVLSGEPLLESKLAPVGTKGGLSAVIGEGKRAMTVRVNDVVGVAGFALPGNYVDIVVNTEDDTQKSTDGRPKSISKIVLDHILVLAVAQESSVREEGKPKVVNAVTLEVTPEQAERLDLARSVGQLSLVLRNQLDTSPVLTSGSTKDLMLNHDQQTIAAASPTNLASGSAVAVSPITDKPKPVVKRTVKTVKKASVAKKEQVEVIKGTDKTTESF